MPDINADMARDETWFRSLHARSAENVTRYALRRAASRADAEDAVSETFLVAWRRRADVPEPPEDVLWLYGVARRALANVDRGGRRLERLRARLASEPSLVAEEPFGDDASHAVRAALSDLSELDAEVLRLLVWEGLSHREAAAVLESTENAVALRASRARKRLRELMTDRTAGRT